MSNGPHHARAQATDAAVLDLLRAISRDIAHELRGPVQSIVVHAEVARRGLAEGDADSVSERIEVIEREARRLHRLADSFLGLLRPLPSEPSVFDIATVFEGIDALLGVLARAARTGYERRQEAPAPLVRSSPQALTLCLIRLAVAVRAACGNQGEFRIATPTSPAAVEILLSGRTAEGEPIRPGPDLEHAAATCRQWLMPECGTVEVLPGSDSMAPCIIRIRLPRADMA